MFHPMLRGDICGASREILGAEVHIQAYIIVECRTFCTCNIDLVEQVELGGLLRIG